MTREEIMEKWDSWVTYHKLGGGGSWPTDAFESLLDYFDEKIQNQCHCLNPLILSKNYCTKCGGDLYQAEYLDE